MSDAGIRAALERAAGTWTCLCHPSAPCGDCVGYAAKAVAAFLPALPLLIRTSAGQIIDPGDPDKLAVAVEEAITRTSSRT